MSLPIPFPSARGFHGTSVEAARRILAEGFRPSANTPDWLGDGIYFWQDAPLRAQEWATTRFGHSSAVIAATIDLEGCLDLLDIAWQQAITNAYEDFMALMGRLREPPPRQTEGAHRLDREIVNFLVGGLAADGNRVRSVRAAFSEGEPLFPGSAFTKRAHVQIAVRDLTAISDVEVLR